MKTCINVDKERIEKKTEKIGRKNKIDRIIGALWFMYVCNNNYKKTFSDLFLRITVCDQKKKKKLDIF